MSEPMCGGDGLILLRSGDYMERLEGEGEYVVPAGVYGLDVIVVAAGGGAAGDAPGEDGEAVRKTLAVQPGDRFTFKVGRGGRGGKLPGEHGRDGEDSIFAAVE